MRTVLPTTLLALLLCTPFAHADATSPVGLWQTIDDVTKKPTALIRITEQDGQLQGRIDKLILAPGAKAEYEIVSTGKDGQPGGTGENADIGSQ